LTNPGMMFALEKLMERNIAAVKPIQRAIRRVKACLKKNGNIGIVSTKNDCAERLQTALPQFVRKF